jgi:hypothetical protein
MILPESGAEIDDTCSYMAFEMCLDICGNAEQDDC